MMNERKVALITGGNKGLGLELARQLGQDEITVVLGSRDAIKGQAAAEQLRHAGIDAHSVTLDVSRDESVAGLEAHFRKAFGRLDILVNNAGMYPKGEITRSDFQETFNTNVFGAWAVTQALLPLLKESPAGRIVNQSSILGSLGTISTGDVSPEWLNPVYSASKSALNALTVVLSRQLADTPIKVNSAHPGWVKTDMGGENADLNVQEGARTAYHLATLGEDGPTGAFYHLEKKLPW